MLNPAKPGTRRPVFRVFLGTGPAKPRNRAIFRIRMPLWRPPRGVLHLPYSPFQPHGPRSAQHPYDLGHAGRFMHGPHHPVPVVFIRRTTKLPRARGIHVLHSLADALRREISTPLQCIRAPYTSATASCRTPMPCVPVRTVCCPRCCSASAVCSAVHMYVPATRGSVASGIPHGNAVSALWSAHDRAVILCAHAASGGGYAFASVNFQIQFRFLEPRV